MSRYTEAEKAAWWAAIKPVLANRREAHKLVTNREVDHLFKPGTRFGLREYLTDAGCTPEVIAAYLDDKGNWQCHESGALAENFYTLKPDVFNKALKEFLMPFYRGSTQSLDHIYEEGFAVHDETHIDEVVDKTIYMMRQKLASDEEICDAIAAARIHDIGNTLSRKVHSFISPEIFERLLPIVKSNPKRWRTIRRAMQWHDEPVAFALFLEHKLKNPPQDPEEFFSEMYSTFGSEALSLIGGDKTEQQDRRASHKANHPRFIDIDTHLVNNLLARTYAMGFTGDQTTFLWEMQFMPGGVGRAERLAHFTEESRHHGGRKMMVPERYRTDHLEKGKTYFESWLEDFWKNNKKRVILTICAIFSNFPYTKEFIFTIHDPGSKETGIDSRSVDLVFRRDHIFEDLQKLS